MAITPVAHESRAQARLPWATDRLVFDHPLPQVLFYAVLFTIPYFRYRDFGPLFFMKWDYVLTAALLAVILPAIIINKIPPQRISGRIWLPLGLFLLVNAVSTLVSPFPDVALQGMVILVAVLIFLTINMVMINDRGVERYVPWVVGGAIALNAFLTALGYFGGVEAFGGAGRAFGGTISANNMALMCVFVIPLMVYKMIYAATGVGRLLGFVFAVLVLIGLVATESRGGFLNLIAVLVLLAAQFRHHFDPRYLGLVVGGTAAVLLAFLILVPQDYLQRQASLQMVWQWATGAESALVQDGALDRRAAYLEVAADVFPEQPLIGSGPFTFSRHWLDSIQTRWFEMEARPAHNTYADVLVGSGLLGLAALLVLLFVTFKNYKDAEDLLRAHGDEAGAHLAGAYKIAFLAILVYFFVKSGLDHKLFILALPLSEAVRRYAEHRVQRILARQPIA